MSARRQPDMPLPTLVLLMLANLSVLATACSSPGEGAISPDSGPISDSSRKAATFVEPGEPRQEGEATEVMRRVEDRFRAGHRALRLDIVTRRQQEETIVGIPPYEEVTLWGVLSSDDQQTRMLFIFLQPQWVRGTALFLSDPRGSLEEDRMWYRMRSFNRFMNLPESSLGLLVAGTCLSFEQAHGYLSGDKYDFAWKAESKPDATGEDLVILGRPHNPQLAEHLGISALEASVDPSRVLLKRVVQLGPSGEATKVYETVDPIRVGEAWLPRRGRVEDLAGRVVSEIEFSYWPLASSPPEDLFATDTDDVVADRLLAFLLDQGIAVESASEDLLTGQALAERGDHDLEKEVQ